MNILKIFSNSEDWMLFKDYLFYRTLTVNLKGCKTVLDVGCGEDSPLSRIKKTFTSEGIDIYKPSLKKSKRKKNHDFYKTGNILFLRKHYKDKQFDAVISLDVVEHLNKDKALCLINDMEKIAKKKIIILTPNGFQHQDHLEGNPFQEHKSGWSTLDFQRLGYTVRGLRGFKFVRGEHATIKYEPWYFWGVVAFVSDFLTYFFPTYSYHLIAIKEIKK